MNIPKIEKVNKILIELKRFSEEILTLEPPLTDLVAVENFEKKYSLKLPNDFKYLLLLHNGIDLMGTTVYGFSGVENLESNYEYEHFEVIIPQYSYLVPFSPDGAGNFYCFDTRIQTDNGDSCPVVFWTSNYEYNENDQPEITNSSLVEWIEVVMIGWTLESYSYDGSDKN